MLPSLVVVVVVVVVCWPPAVIAVVGVLVVVVPPPAAVVALPVVVVPGVGVAAAVVRMNENFKKNWGDSPSSSSSPYPSSWSRAWASPLLRW